jgi:pimeloyl-ACP methyl ester carboxylesterase
VSLAPTVNALAQQPAQVGAPAQGATRARAAKTLTEKETPVNKLKTVRLDTVSDTATAAIRPFRVDIPEEALVDLRQRIAATRWPDKETVADRSQGVQLARLQALVRYWGTDYDWRKVEAKLNALPQFVTEIDGLDIQFMHVRSRHPNALPLIITHGWPGSVLNEVDKGGHFAAWEQPELFAAELRAAFRSLR